MNNLTEENIKTLITIAEKTPQGDTEDFDPSESGNFDDTYYMGTEDGEIYMARTVLTMLGIEYKIKGEEE
jgi:hypothetical protein